MNENQYKIISASSTSELEEDVASWISLGWEPVGSMSVEVHSDFFFGDTEWFHQPMTKKEEKQ